MKNVELAPIFDLQKEHIWHNNRHWDFNDLTKLDIDKYVGRKLDPATNWEKVKEIIEREREGWRKKEQQKFDQLLE
ncbi:MAG: hypothetical protein A2Y23_00150 [Clostridiales bacterium GWB2_37_7]|nr:MAG: hypothetical protein A2Y23_00150 [Clostridiales bacterium GWB2_37_7]